MPVAAHPSISLELCHLHAPERLVPILPRNHAGENLQYDHVALYDLALQISGLEENIRNVMGIDASVAFSRVGLLDDIAVREKQRNSADSWRWESFINYSRESLNAGIKADHIFDESAFEHTARKFASQAEARSKSLGFHVTDSGRVFIPTNYGEISVRLRGFQGVEDLTFPSCALLDLAWTQKRALCYSQTITTLPESFRAQQLQVAALAALLELPGMEEVSCIFLNPAGDVENNFQFRALKLVLGSGSD